MAQKSHAEKQQGEDYCRISCFTKPAAVLFNFQDAHYFFSSIVSMCALNSHFQTIHILSFLFKRRMDIAIKSDFHVAMS